jgi:hypothetical protein
VGDEEGVDAPRLGNTKESDESTSVHVETRAYICEDNRVCPKLPSARSSEGLELTVQVAIAHLPVAGYSGVHSTSPLSWALKRLPVEQS